MTIKIHKPELEALIMEQLRTGAFDSIEEVLMQALRGSSLPPQRETRTGADLIAAMQASPSKDIDLESTKVTMPVRDTNF